MALVPARNTYDTVSYIDGFYHNKIANVSPMHGLVLTPCDTDTREVRVNAVTVLTIYCDAYKDVIQAHTQHTLA